jgi:hypothetical protein
MIDRDSNVAHRKPDFDNGNPDTVVHIAYRRNNDFVSVPRPEWPKPLTPTNRKLLLTPFSLPLGLRRIIWQGVCQWAID